MIDVICGARPNFMKIDSVLRNLPAGIERRLVHTGQHYDDGMYRSFFEQLGLPTPDVDLGVGSASLSVQTARIMIEYEKAVLSAGSGIELVVVVGDVNSTLACSLVAARFGIPVAHVEAGLRSFDRDMPEEINRILTDQIAELLLITSPEAEQNLISEGKRSNRIVMVGNPMIDTLLRLLPEARERVRAGQEPSLLAEGGPYGLVTLHRPSNVDDPDRLERILEAFGRMSELRFIFPAHPRTRRSLERTGLLDLVPANLQLLSPMGYLGFLSLQDRAAVVVTDSGGIQEETSVLGVPCVTLRRNTERPITISLGTNCLCPEPEDLPEAVEERMSARPAEPPSIPLWDGRSGERISGAISEFLDSGNGWKGTGE